MDASVENSQLNPKSRLGSESRQPGASFITKINEILQDESCRDCIHWNSDGSAFLIPSLEKFANFVLPKYFKHSNYSSFVRQLNMYGFRKIKTDEGQSCYSHDMFKKNEAPLHKIKRLKLKKNQSDDEEDEKFLEKYSGTRRNTTKKDVKESTDFQQIQTQLASLTEKFKIIEETTDSLKNTISTQNGEIQKLMTELIQLRSEEDNKFQSVLSELMAPSRKPESLYETQEHLRMKNLGAPDSLAQFNALQKSQFGGDTNAGMENKNTANLGWYSSDYYNQFANAQAQVALAKAKLIGDSFMATKESMGSFNQPLNGCNPIFSPRYLGGAKLPGNEMGSFMRPNTLEQAYMMGGEQPAYQRYYNENIPDNAFDGPEQVEENFAPQKRVQKSNVRNGQNESDSKNRNPM